MTKFYLVALLLTQGICLSEVEHYSICSYLPAKETYSVKSIHVDRGRKLAHMVSFLSPTPVESVPGKYEYTGIDGSDVSVFFTENDIYTYPTGKPQLYGRRPALGFSEIEKKIFVNSNEYIAVFINKNKALLNKHANSVGIGDNIQKILTQNSEVDSSGERKLALPNGEILKIRFSNDGAIEDLIWTDGTGRTIVQIKENVVEGGHFSDEFLPVQFRSSSQSVHRGVFGFAVKPFSDGWIEILSVSPDTAAGRAGLTTGEIVKLKNFNTSPNATLAELHEFLINANEITLERKSGEQISLTKGN